MPFTTKQIERRTSDYVCDKCGAEFLSEAQKKESRIYTAHMAKCGLCGMEVAVTHIRQYNYLRYPKSDGVPDKG